MVFCAGLATVALHDQTQVALGAGESFKSQ